MAAAIVQTILGAALLAAGAQIRFAVPGSEVPVTAQTFVLALLAGLGGARVGVGAVVTYIVMAACGVGVLSGGRGGWAAVSGPSAGYLVGFAAAAIVIPLALRALGRRSGLRIWLAIEAGSVCVLGLGMLGLILAGRPPEVAWTTGVWPFLPGDLVKSTAAAFIVWLAARRRG